MVYISDYEALSSSSPRSEVTQTLQSIISAQPTSFSTSAREGLVQALLDDVHACATTNGGKGANGTRLTKKDAQLALLAVKTLGRIPAGSQVLSRRENLTRLLSIIKSLNGSDSEASQEALRCVANALLLIEEGRSTWIQVQGCEYCLDLLESATSPTVLFLTSRILFLSTASSSSPLIPALLNTPSPSLIDRFDTLTHSSSKRQDVIKTLSSRLDLLLTAILQGTPMAREAMTDLLKFTFNLLAHWPKIMDSPEIVGKSKGKGKAKKSEEKEKEKDEPKIMGDCWSERLDGILQPLLRTFLGLPPTFPSPLMAPLTHVIHTLLPVPFNKRLYPVWFPDHPPPPSPPTSSPEPSPSSSPTGTGPAPLPASSSRSSTPPSGDSDNSKDSKESKPGGGRFDRAKSMLTPRLSLSSRSSSPAPPGRRTSPPSSSTRGPSGEGNSNPPEIIVRAADLLDVTLSHYLPEAVDPDDASVRARCAKEDVELDDVLSPLVLLMTRICKANEDARKYVLLKMIPPDLDRSKQLEHRPDALGRCLRLLPCVRHQKLKDAVGELLYILCDSDAQTMSMQIGYGNAAGYLFNRGIMAPPAPNPSSSSTTNPSSTTGPSISFPHTGVASETINAAVNPITGMVGEQRQSLPEMTQEEKEREAEKLFVLFDRLEKAGGGENPLRRALHEGRLEKYRDQGGESDSD